MKNPFKTLITLLFSVFISITSISISNANESISGLDQLESMIDKHKGDVIYLDFWASWCIPCRKSFPWMNEIQTKYATKGFTVIAVNLDVEKSLADEFLLDVPANFPVIFDPSGDSARKLKLKGMPSSFLIDRDGKFVKRHNGFFSDKKPLYETEIEELLTSK